MTIKNVLKKKLTVKQRYLLWGAVGIYGLTVATGSLDLFIKEDNFSFYDHRAMVSCTYSKFAVPEWSCKNSSGFVLSDEIPPEKRVWLYDNENTKVERAVSHAGASYSLFLNGSQRPLVYVVQ